MDDFLNQNSTQGSDEPSQPEMKDIEPDQKNDEYSSVYNPINYTPIKPQKETNTSNKGVKVFALVVAAALILTAVGASGYFWGRKGSIGGPSANVELDLSSRPKDTDEMTAAEVYEKVNKSVVGIVVYDALGENGSQASGIVFSEDGYIITNDHIYEKVPSAKFKVYTYDGRAYDAEFVAGDNISDLAVLKIKEPKDLVEATFGNSNELYHGQNVVAIGRPTDATADSSITTGIISAVSRRITGATNYNSRVIQTDCAINPGSSGGALVDMHGHIIGVTSAKLVSTAYDNVGYAIPTTVMKRIVEELISKGKVVSRAKLGITYTAVDELAAEISNYDHTGLYIASVAEDSGLYGKAEEGDIITHINDVKVDRDEIVLDVIENSRAGDTISLTIVTKDGKTKSIDVELKANISESSYKTVLD